MEPLLFPPPAGDPVACGGLRSRSIYGNRRGLPEVDRRALERPTLTGGQGNVSSCGSSPSNGALSQATKHATKVLRGGWILAA